MIVDVGLDRESPQPIRPVSGRSIGTSEQSIVTNDEPLAERPRAITAAAWVFIVVGAGGILKDVLPLLGPGGASALEGLLVAAWMAFHVGLSLFHSPLEAAAHIAIFSGLAYVLFRQQATNYFTKAQGRASNVSDGDSAVGNAKGRQS